MRICRPSPCVISSMTAIRATHPSSVTVTELDHNYLVCVRGSRVDRLVYPKKVWESVDELLRWFISSDRLPQQGFVFYGPPGTGKTSMAKIIAEMYGLPTFKIDPLLQSKWYGETEKNLYNIMREAEAKEPSVVLMDDCDWLLLDRGLKSKETSATTQLSVMRVVLETIERWNENGRKVLVVATTNASIELLDQALLRSGRLGRPVYIPLPDYEAVYEFLVSEGVSPDTARRWAVRAVNLGLGMADIKLDVLPKLKQNVEPIVEPRTERGYRRYIVDLTNVAKEVEPYFKVLDVTGDFPNVVRLRSARGSRTVVWFSGPENVSIAVANAFITYYSKLPAVTLVDVRYVSDAAEASNMLKGFLIIPTQLMDQRLSGVLGLAQCIAYAGKGVHEGFRIDVRGTLGKTIDRRVVMRGAGYTVLTFYGANAGRDEVERLVQLGLSRGEDWFFNVLNNFGYYGASVSHLEYTTQTQG
ncbi:MAG: AAA family ATPase [Thermosphaera sp.]